MSGWIGTDVTTQWYMLQLQTKRALCGAVPKAQGKLGEPNAE
jgi:hypothetical protein